MTLKSFDPSVPNRLLKLQKWFASCITTPEGDRKGILKKLRAKEFILPSSTLTSDKRIGIYQQQYWWRLLRILNESYPALIRLFGLQVFNHTIAVPYLSKYPSKTWTLNELGKDLPKWIAKNYCEEDKSLIFGMAEIDHAFEKSFLSKAYPPLSTSYNEENIAQLLAQKIYFQPHVKIFELPFHLFFLRQALLKESIAHWEDNPFPELLQEKIYHFILYRNPSNQIVWEEIQLGAYRLICLLQRGNSLQNACQLLEEEGGVVEEEAQAHLALWLQHWIKLGLLTTKK